MSGRGVGQSMGGRFFDNMGLQKKLLLSYLIFVLMPLTLFTLFSALYVRHSTKTRSLQAATQSFMAAKFALTGRLEQLDHVLTIVGHQRRVYELLLQSADAPLHTQYARTRELGLFLENVRNVGRVDALGLYGETLAVNNDKSRPASPMDGLMPLMETIRNEAWFARCKEAPSGTIWISNNDYAAASDGKTIVSAARFLHSPDNPHRPLALARADLSLDSLAETIKHTPLTPRGIIALYDERLRCITRVAASPEHAALPWEDGRELSAEDLAPMFDSLPDDSWTHKRMRGRVLFVKRSTLQINGWHVLSIIPDQDVYGEADNLVLRFALVMICLGLAAFFLVRGIWRSALSRIRILTAAMEATRGGDLGLRLEDHGGDEIGALIRDFDGMMERLSFLMRERIEDSKKITGLELKALQAQINPHFLYNALDMINCVAIDRDVREISIMATLLARFYRLTLNHGEELIFVADQIEHARLYVEIQNIRFGNAIVLRIEQRCDIEGLCMMNLIVQPIIENAILHGILESDAKRGVIEMYVDRDESTLHITVTDDGVGMPLSASDQDGGGPATQGYGMRNIMERIRLAYGPGYGLTIHSEEGKGCRVRISLPLLQKTKGESA